MSNTPETDAAWQADKDIVYRVETSRKLERERDDALSQIAQAENRAERFCQERDEAREDLEFRRELYKVQDKYLDDARRERDEAREAIVGWENKWKCAIDMAARAELERDDALNKLNNLKNILR